MTSKHKRYFWLLILVSAIIIAAVIIRSIKKQQTPLQTQQQTPQEMPTAEVAEPKPPTKPAKPKSSSSITLKDVIKTARMWQPIYNAWFGKPAPDFTLTDINGKTHKLSDYRGKNIIITFWATWCGPCLMELPHLIELRKNISNDKLTILAISNENPALVKRFAAAKKINYAVFAVNTRTLPRPFNSILYIPSNFFINPEGKIKLATTGVLSLTDMKAILNAP